MTSEPPASASTSASASASASAFQVLFDQPHVKRALEDMGNRSFKSAPKDYDHEYMLGYYGGLYEDECTVDGNDPLSWEARKSACEVVSSVVGLSCRTGKRLRKCSGIIIEYEGMKKIATSTYILGDHLSHSFSAKVDVLLPSQQKVCGYVSFMDEHHNVLLIHADEIEDMSSITLKLEMVELGEKVTAVGLHSSSRVMASIGEVNVRGDHFESDDLMSSSCTIAEWGIGGPLVDYSGRVIGINFFSKKCFTPFLPSLILMKCVEHLLVFGKVIRPWLGIKTRSLNELKLEELELISLKFNTISGMIVREVAKGSPADLCGICAGDVIISCNGTPVNSAVEFAGILFKITESCQGKKTRKAKEKALSVKVVIQRVSSGEMEDKHIKVKRFSPSVINQWPVLPKSDIPADVHLVSYVDDDRNRGVPFFHR